MPAVKTPAESDKLPGSPHDSAPEATRERREAEQLIPIGNRRRHSSGARSL